MTSEPPPALGFPYSVTDDQIRDFMRLSAEARLRHVDDALDFVRKTSTPAANRMRAALRRREV